MLSLEPTTIEAVVGAAVASGSFLTGAAVAILHPRATFFGPAVWRGSTKRMAVALTFDDGPDPVYTRRIADILDAHQARATFFCIGRRLELDRSLAKSLHGSGHQLENHTYNHSTGRHLFSTRDLIKDLLRCQELIGTLTGRVPTYYRPAVGIRNPPVHAAARALGLTVVTWTLAARDGLFALTPRRALSLAERADAGSIIALHDGRLHGSASVREQTVGQLPLLLSRLKDRGFACETLTELLET